MDNPLPTRLYQLFLLGMVLFSPATPAETLSEAQRAYTSGHFETAMKISLSLAQQGVTDAEVLVGKMYLQGEGVKQDIQKAYAWFEASASKGNKLGQVELGLMHYNGTGIKRNFGEAFRWFNAAANSGDVGGAYKLANLYAAGEGVTQDYALATHWYRYAADHGHALSMFQLGKLYYAGRSAQPDKIKAYEYFTLAEENGVRKAALARAELEKEMTPTELSVCKKNQAKRTAIRGTQ